MVRDKEVQSAPGSRTRLITTGGGCGPLLKGDRALYIGSNPASKDQQ